MLCSNCGKENADTATFCASCGGKISGGAAQPPPASAASGVELASIARRLAARVLDTVTIVFTLYIRLAHLEFHGLWARPESWQTAGWDICGPCRRSRTTALLGFHVLEGVCPQGSAVRLPGRRHIRNRLGIGLPMGFMGW